MTARRVLWNWNVHTHPIEQKLEAAVAGDFDVLTVHYGTFRAALDSRSGRELLALAADGGVTLDFLDGMSSWSSTRYPAGNDLLRETFDYSVDEAFRLCEELEVRNILSVSGFDHTAVPPTAQLIEEFGNFCDRAAKEGIWVDLEPMALLGISTLELAWEIVRDAGRVNSGLLIDTWHLRRGGSNLDLLKEIPREKIRNVQVVDGGLEPIGETLWDDAFARVLPGEGELPLVETLATLHDLHDIRSIGPEAISPELDALTPAEVGRRAAAATESVIQRAGFER